MRCISITFLSTPFRVSCPRAALCSDATATPLSRKKETNMRETDDGEADQLPHQG